MLHCVLYILTSFNKTESHRKHKVQAYKKNQKILRFFFLAENKQLGFKIQVKVYVKTPLCILFIFSKPSFNSCPID